METSVQWCTLFLDVLHRSPNFPLNIMPWQWNSFYLLFPVVIVMGLIKPFKYTPHCQFCVLFALSNTSVLLKVSRELALWRWKLCLLNIDGFIPQLVSNTKALMAATECSPLSRTVQQTTWTWLRLTNFFPQTKSTFSFTTSTVRETQLAAQQIGRTLLAAEPTARQCAKWPRTVLQLFKILKASLVLKEAAAGCSCQPPAFHPVRFAVLTSIRRSSGSRASPLLVWCRTVVPPQLHRRFGVLRSNRDIDQVLCLFPCLLLPFRAPCHCLTARLTCSLSRRPRQRKALAMAESLAAKFSATVVKTRRVWKPECRLYPQDPTRLPSRVILHKLSHITLAQS